MDKVFVDTDILIDYSKGYDKILKTLLTKQQQNNLELFLNPIVIAEFFTDKELSDKTNHDKACQFLNFFTTVEINAAVGFLAGEFLREKSVSFLGDAFIAASCVKYSLKLATRNKNHFEKVTGLAFYRLR